MREFKYNVRDLIQCVRERPCLWDKTIENYKDRIERRTAWEEIFTLLDDRYNEMTPEDKRVTGESILNKWTNIRDTFIKTLKNKMGKPKKRYMLHDDLKFLTKIKPEETPVEEDNEEFSMKQEIEQESTYIPKKRSKRKLNEDDTKSNDFSGSEVSYHSEKKKKQFDFTEEEQESGYGKRKSKRNAKPETDYSVDETLNTIDFVEVDEANDARVMNEDEAFFASLLPTIVKYSEDERLEFRIEVLGVMKKIKDKRKWNEDSAS